MGQAGIALEFDDRQLQKLPAIARERAERGIRRGGPLIEATAKRKAPHRTQNLVNSGTTLINGSGYDTEAEIIFRAPYSIFVHDGTGLFGPKQRMFEITPKNQKALFWPGADHPVKRVLHPGQKGQPFLQEAFDEEGPGIMNDILG